MNNIDSVFLELSDKMKQQFFACFNYFCDKKGITTKKFMTNISMYERDFLSTWNLHCMLLSGDDECYGRLVHSEQS